MLTLTVPVQVLSAQTTPTVPAITSKMQSMAFTVLFTLFHLQLSDYVVELRRYGEVCSAVSED